AGAAPGPPALSAGWIVWPVGATVPSLWAVPREAAREGFQLTDASGAQRAPLLDGDLVVWLDESTRPPTLRSFDLQTGRAQAVVQAPIRPGDYDLAGSVVVWVADEGDGPALYHHRLDRP
ncbi:MAG: hypothetical protein KC583_09405, partial [Myxococcales bacterium]|nr:hypothetical protein [Myxococcales bacterium]